jgi:hypothetical protein
MMIAGRLGIEIRVALVGERSGADNIREKQKSTSIIS